MHLNKQLHFITHSFPYHSDTFLGAAHLLPINKDIISPERVPLEMPKALGYGLLGQLGIVFEGLGRKIPGIVIDLDPGMACPTQQGIYRHVETLTQDVPKSHFYSTKCAEEGERRLPVAIAVYGIPMKLNLAGVFPNKVSLQVVNSIINRPFVCSETSFPQAHNSFISAYLEKEPIPPITAERISFDSRNLHLFLLLLFVALLVVPACEDRIG
jgi:hypothetical protein